jgi:hypothetical protein
MKIKRFVTLNCIYLLLAILVLVSVSATYAQDSTTRTFDQTLAEKTVTFEAVNPYTNELGIVTITVKSGDFHVARIGSGRKAGWSIVSGKQEGVFVFTPYDTSQPTFAGPFKFSLTGEIAFDRHSDTLPLSFVINTSGSDGSELKFAQSELATVNEYGADVSFTELTRLNVQPLNQ